MDSALKSNVETTLVVLEEAFFPLKGGVSFTFDQLLDRIATLEHKVALIDYGIQHRYTFQIPTSRAVGSGDPESFWSKVEADIGERVRKATG